MKRMRMMSLCLVAVIGFVASGVKAENVSIVGKWKFDLGGGFIATVEYKTDGTLIQTMNNMTIKGTYVLNGNKLTTVVGKQTTTFTIVSRAGMTMTLKRDSDGRTIVYTKI